MPQRRLHTRFRTKRDAIVETWISCARAPVGEQVLREVQRVVASTFGDGAVDSPAAIARVLADEGADLRHPEVIEFDACWRDQKLDESRTRDPIGAGDPAKPLTLKSAVVVLKRLEKLRKEFESKDNRAELRRVRELALNEKARAQLLVRDDRLRAQARAAQTEIADWFRVWLQTPHLFEDWLELRRRSPEFKARFPGS